jgi:hypothetical protein
MYLSSNQQRTHVFKAPKLRDIAMLALSDMRLPELEIFQNGGICWAWSLMRMFNKKMSQEQYDALKAWPESDLFKAWVKDKKPDKAPLDCLMRHYPSDHRNISRYNGFDGFEAKAEET